VKIRIIAALSLLALSAYAQRVVAPGQVNTVSGTGSTLVTTTGAQTSGNCVTIDANGNHVAAGAACGSGSGGSIVLSVKDYGAKGDGTTDDTTSITSAITAAAGKTLWFPDGNYIHSPITIANAVTLMLSDGAKLTLKAASTSSQFTISSSHVTIRGGAIDGNTTNNAGASNGVFIQSGISDVTMDYVQFLNHTQSHILTLGTTGPNASRIFVRHCTFLTAGVHAVYFNWNTVDSEIANNTFLGGSQNAIWVGNSSTNVKVLNNRISGYARMGIEIWGGSNNATVTGNTISNVGTASTAFGISIDSSTGTAVANNNVNLTSPGVGNVGIEIVLSDDSTVTGNVVQNASTGMTVNQSSNVTVTGNRIVAFTGVAGIQLGTSAVGHNANANTVTGNRITISQTTGSAIGIWLQANATGVTVNDNAIVGNVITGQNTTSGVGIMLEQDTGTLSRNQVSSNAIATVQYAVNHLNDANTSQVLNQYDGVGTKDAGSTTNGRAARFDAYTLAMDDNNNKLIQPGTGSNVLISGIQIGSTSGPRFGNSGGDGLVIPGSDSNTALAVTNAAGSSNIFRVTTSGRAAVLLPGTFAGNNTCNTANEGSLTSISDSTTITTGATITGGGTNHVLGFCNGTNWIVTSGSKPATGLVAESVLSSPTASVTFSSLPSGYRDLKLVVRGRGTNASGNSQILLQANGDAGANYDYAGVASTNGAPFGVGGTAQSIGAQVGWIPAASAGTNFGNTTIVQIGNFAGTTFEKTFIGTTSFKSANANGSIYSGQFAGFWRSTSAITSLTVTLDAGNFAAGTIVSLYAEGLTTPL
jgi:parallel beta-helix repeat protein